jgi:hypothetical protein
MRIYDADPDRVTNISTPGMFGIEHNGEKVLFNNGRTRTRSLTIPLSTNGTEVLRHINLVFSSLPKEDQEFIFNTYVNIRDILDSVVDPTMLMLRLKKEVSNLYKKINYETVCKVISTKSPILTPSRIVNDYEDMEISERSQDQKNYRVTTYLKKDYLDLIYMAIYIKPMIPVWCDYIRTLDSPGGKTTHRDYQAIGLISSTDIIELPAFDRLREYIQANIINITRQPGTRVPNTVSAIFGGLGSSELPDWLMAKTIIRKLILIELSTNDDNSSVISIIYKNVESELNSLGRKFSGQITYKKKPKEAETGDDKSLLEIYKMQQDHSDGDNTITTMYGEKSLSVLLRKFNSSRNVQLELKTVKACFDSISKSKQLNLSPAQETLLGWIVHPLIHFHGIEYQDMKSIFKFQSLAMAYLFHHGFTDLAILISATKVVDDDGELLGGLTSKNLVNKQNLNLLIETYPHYHERNAKESIRQKNLGCVGVDLVCDELIQCDWIPICPNIMIEATDQVDEYGTLIPPSNVRNQVAEVLLLLNE